MPAGSDWDRIFDVLTRRLRGEGLPSVSEIAARRRDPFSVLVSTVISLRTRDEVTADASGRLLAAASGPAALLELSEESVARLIYPAGFYRTKARGLREIARLLLERHRGEVPPAMDDLPALPGVGRKTANLVRNLGFGLDGICVDTHVHRISNRLGWVRTRRPEATEQALMEVLPRRYWIPLNKILVQYGRKVCSPVSPFCSHCPLADECPRHGVERSR